MATTNSGSESLLDHDLQKYFNVAVAVARKAGEVKSFIDICTISNASHNPVHNFANCGKWIKLARKFHPNLIIT